MRNRTKTTPPNKKSWHLIYCKPRKEMVAMENLNRQQYEVFLPMAQVLRRRQGAHQYVIEPMFPRYLFIHLDTSSDNCSPIRSTKGVISLVNFGGVPAKVPNKLIEQIRELKPTDPEHQDTIPKFQKGAIIRVLDGAFLGYEGIFENHSGERRANILLMISDRYTRVQMPVDYVDLA